MIRDPFGRSELFSKNPWLPHRLSTSFTILLAILKPFLKIVEAKLVTSPKEGAVEFEIVGLPLRLV
ncbi:MAG: hypothetical protein ACJAQT_000079 [Akkermansiaceae bacterium]|jgi:hypothetical protein